MRTSRYLPILLLGLILFLGAFLRFYRQGELAAFRTDQAIELSGAKDILSGKLTLIGIKTSNSEVRNGAVMYYLLAPFIYFFRGDPRAGGMLQSLLSLGTVIVVYLIAKKYIGAREALFASFLTATSSLLVLYSRQTMLAFYPLFFNSLIFLVCHTLIKKHQPLLTLILGSLLGITLQIHYSTIALVFAALFIPPLFLNRGTWFKYYFFLFSGFLLGLSPMVVFELRHDFFNTKMLIALFKQPPGPNVLTSLNSLMIYWQDALSRLLFGGNILLTRIYLLVLAGATISLRNKISLTQKLALLFILCSIVFTIVFSKDIRPPYEYISHYALVSFLPLILLNSELLGKLSALFLYPAVIFFLVINFPGYGLFNNHGYSHSGGWGLVGIEKAADLIKNDLTDRPYNVMMLVDAENQGHPLRYLLNGLPNQPLPINAYDQARDLYVITEPGLDLKRVDLWEINSFGPFEITKTWPIQNGFLLHRLVKLNEAKKLLLPKPPPATSPRNFLTLIYPVRGTPVWANPSFAPLHQLLSSLSDNNLPATFLLQYDALIDKTIVDTILSKCSECEFGILLEVSESLATDALVSYKIGDGHWARPDKTFLSGYQLLERKRLINTTFTEFKKQFGYFPVSVGGWYVDPYSLNYLADKYKISGLVSVADQYNTDAQRYWGKPWGVPYYSQKFDLISPAASADDKLDIVQIQWAQRHPTDGFGNGVWYSQNSFQANDYTNNRREDSFFPNLLGNYLDNDNPFNQITIGLEVGQELTAFANEHKTQLTQLKRYIDTQTLLPVTMRDFSQWYKKNYPDVSPVTKITDGTTLWVNAPCYRLGLQTDAKTGQITPLDLRVYRAQSITNDNFRADNNPFLSREVESQHMRFPHLLPPISITGYQSFTANSFTLEDRLYDFSLDCLNKPSASFPPIIKIRTLELLELINNLLSLIKTSVINGHRIFGFSTSPVTIAGFWSGQGFGIFPFPFQTLVKFQSPRLSDI